MKRHLKIVLLATLGLLLLISNSATNSLGQIKSENSCKKITEQAKVCLLMSKDFRQMAKARSDDRMQRQIGIDLAGIATTAHDYLSASSDMLFICSMIGSCSSADQRAVKSYINDRMNDYSSLIDYLIEEVNLNLSYSDDSGMATTGARLRDELRKGQSLLKSSLVSEQ